MKPLIIISLLISTISVTYAQNERSFTPHHEINLSQGVFPLVPSLLSGMLDKDISPPTTAGDYNNALYREGATYTTGAITFNYMYNALKWLSYGASVSFYGIYTNTYDRIKGTVVGKDYQQSLSTMGMMRFTYLDRELVRLYGKIGLGVGMHWETDKINEYDFSEAHPFLAINLTLFGIQVGKDLYGFGELGYSANGVVQAGVGYKF